MLGKNCSFFVQSSKKLFVNGKNPVLASVRYKHRVYIQKPFPRPKIMQVIEELSTPILGLRAREQPKNCELPDLRAREIQLTEYELFLSRRLQEMFDEASDGMVLAFQPPSVNGRIWREIRILFQRCGITLRVFHPRVVQHVIAKTKYANLSQLFMAPTVLGFSGEAKTIDLAKALKQCPDMHLLACCVYDRMLSMSQVEQLNKLGTTNQELAAQTISITRSIPAALVTSLRSSYLNTARILKVHAESSHETAKNASGQ